MKETLLELIGSFRLMFSGVEILEGTRREDRIVFLKGQTLTNDHINKRRDFTLREFQPTVQEK